MKNTARILAVLMVIFTSYTFIKAQTEISEEKRQLIAEIITLTKADEQMKSSMDAMFMLMETSYPSSFKTALDARNNLTARQKEKLIKDFSNSQKQFTGKFKEKMAQRINNKEIIEELMFPVYAKLFEVNELKDLVVFYKSPTGQKLIEVSPQIMMETVKMSQTTLLPKLNKIVEEIITEDINNLGQK